MANSISDIDLDTLIIFDKLLNKNDMKAIIYGVDLGYISQPTYAQYIKYEKDIITERFCLSHEAQRL